MNDEIKEILDNLKFTNNDVMWCDKIILDVEQSHSLLDYITNLQQAIKDTKDTADDMLYELKQENERLTNNWNELEEWLKSNEEHFAEAIPFRETLRKMKEIKENNE